MSQKNKVFEVSSIDQFLKLAKTPPDEALLRRFFSACLGQKIDLPLTDAECRWLTVNLDANSVWQQKWRELEAEFGTSVDWKSEGIIRPQSLFKQKHEKRTWAGFVDTLLPVPAFRFAAAAVLIVIILYGGLRIVGNATLPEMYQLASISNYETVLSENVRGEVLVNKFSTGVGIAELLAAPSDWLGLFPHYDLTRVDKAIHHLHTAFQETADEFQKAEIAFFLAKAYLMKSDKMRAKVWLNEVLAQNVADYREEAIDLLSRLATETQRSQSEN